MEGKIFLLIVFVACAGVIYLEIKGPDQYKFITRVINIIKGDED